MGDSTFQYAFEGSNPYYIKVRVLNARVPTSKMTATVKGQTRDMTPTQDNAFLLTEGGPFSFPIEVHLTSIQGDTVTDTITKGPEGTTQGSAQYPRSQLDQVDTTSTSGASVQGATVGALQVCNVTLEPFSACGGINVGVGDAQIPGGCCPDNFVCVRQQEFYWQCLEEALDNSTSSLSPKPVPLPALSPLQAPSGAEAPSYQAADDVRSSSAQPSIVCQFVQELLNVPSLSATCKWHT